MPRKKSQRLENAKWNYEAILIMSKLLELPEFSADNYHALAVQAGMPPAQIARTVSGIFKRYAASKRIIKSNRFVLSRRNDSAVLPIWVSSKWLKEVLDDGISQGI